MSTATAALVATCSHCAKKFKVDPKHAGKRVKCKACGQPFQIPSLAQTVSAAPSAAVRAQPRPRPQPAPLTAPQPVADPRAEEDPFAALDQLAAYAETAPKIDVVPAPLAPPRLASPQQAQYVPPMVAPQPVARPRVMAYATPQRRQPQNGASDGPNTLIPTLVVGGIGLLGALVSGIDGIGTVGLALAIPCGLVLAVWGGIGNLVVAFRESALCGVLYMFINIYALYYVITRWSNCAGNLGRSVLGVAILFVAAIMQEA